MKLSFRWYGISDPVTLQNISQIPGMRSVVSAVYDVKPGEVWPMDSLNFIKDECDKHGLIFDIVESVPVHEDIKLGRGKCDEYIDVYAENIRRCAKVGVKCITYNFMPVFDWTRTQLDKKAKDGSTSLVMYFEQLNGLDPLKDDIHLPGWDASYTQDEVRELIYAYGKLGEEGLWRNLERFLTKIIPVAEECDVKMAIHPDDPPYPIFGLPRIITNEQSLDRLLKIVDSPYNALCFCTGSLGCASFNDIPKLVEKYAIITFTGVQILLFLAALQSIDKTLYELSKEAILSADGQITENEKINLINEYLTRENLKNSDYMRSYREIYDFIKIIPPYEFNSTEID